MTVDAILHSRVKIETERPSIPRSRLITCHIVAGYNEAGRHRVGLGLIIV